MTDLRMLAAAPELFIIELVDRSLEILTRVLLAEHPSLVDKTSQSDVGHHARQIIRTACRLRRTLVAYRRATDRALDQLQYDLPF